jgi:hypothetical protein
LVRIHKTLRGSSATAAGATVKLREIAEIVAAIEEES